MRYITLEDFIDVYSKVAQRGSEVFFSKLTLNKKSRTKSAFSDSHVQSSNWWIIPKVRERWNVLISGNAEVNFKEHFMKRYFSGASDLRLLSLGSGTCSHELELATYSQFSEIVCVDLAKNRLAQAEAVAKERGLENMKFVCDDLKNFEFEPEKFDIVLFNASLHHFENVKSLISTEVKETLKQGGKLIINEYVGPNRLQYPKHQIKAINEALKLIPPKFRRRFKTNYGKNKYHGSGVWRMIIADPSECVDSAAILPAIHNDYKILEETPYGGNILMSTLKDLSHHFVELTPEKEGVLHTLFAHEDAFLENHASDFVFGVYGKS